MNSSNRLSAPTEIKRHRLPGRWPLWVGIAAACACLLPQVASSADKSFIGGYLAPPGDPEHPDSWNNVFHWSPSGLPQPGDEVFLLRDSVMDIPGGTTVAEIGASTGSSSFTLSGTETLTVTGRVWVYSDNGDLPGLLSVGCPVILGDGVKLGYSIGWDTLDPTQLKFTNSVQCNGMVHQVAPKLGVVFHGDCQFNGTYLLERGGLVLSGGGDTVSNTGVIWVGGEGSLRVGNESLGGVFGSGTIEMGNLTYAGSTDGVFSGIIRWDTVNVNHTLERAGTGRLELTGFVDSSITLAVTGGCLAIPPATAAGRTITNSGKLEITADGADTWSATVTGSGRFLKTHLGDLKVGAGGIGCSGGVEVLEGSLTATGNDIMPTGVGSKLTVAAGAKFRLQGHSQTVWEIAGDGIIDLGGGTLTVTMSNNFSGVITGGGQLVKASTGNVLGLAGPVTLTTMQLNSGITRFSGPSLTGNVSVESSATLSFLPTGITTFNGIISGAGDVSIGGAGTLVMQGQLDIGGSCLIDGLLELGRDDALAAATDLTLLGTLDLGGHSQALHTIGSTGEVQLSGGTLTLSPTSDTVIAAALTGAGTVIKSGTSKLTLTGANSFTHCSITGGTLEAAPSSLSGAIQNEGTLVLNTAALLEGFASTVTGPGSLIKRGSGSVVMTMPQSYSGATTVEEGMLIVSASNALPMDSAVSIGNGATLVVVRQSIGSLSGSGSLLLGGDLATNVGLNTAFSGQISGTGSLIKEGPGELFLSGSNTQSGKNICRGGVLAINGDAALGSVPSAVVIDQITLDGGDLRFISNAALAATRGVLLNPTGGRMVVGSGLSPLIAGPMTGVGGLTKTGAGTLRLSGSGSWLGATAIQEGIVEVSGGNAIPDSSTVVMNETFGVALNLGANETIGSLSGGGTAGGEVSLQSYTLTVGADNRDSVYGGIITGTGKLVKTGTGTLELAANGTSYSGGTEILGGILKGNGNSLQGNILNQATIQFSQASTKTFSGSISGTGVLDKIGSGTLLISGTNTYTGATLIHAGRVSTLNGAAIPNSSAVVLDNVAGAILDLDGNEEIGSLAGGGASGGNVQVDQYRLTTGGNGSSTTFAGTITGTTGGLTKSGGGILTLTGACSYTGATNVTAGTLQLNSSSFVVGSSCAIGGTLDLNLASSAFYTGVMSGAGALIKNGYGTLTLAYDQSFTGPVTINQGYLEGWTSQTIGDLAAVTITQGTLSLEYNEEIGSLDGGTTGGWGTVRLDGCRLTLGGNNQSTTFRGLIAGSGGSLRKKGSGTLTLANPYANEYTGGTAFEAGAISVARNDLLGSTSGTLTFAGGTLQVTGTTFTSMNRATSVGAAGGTMEVTESALVLTSSGTMTGTGGLSKTGAGTVVLAGTAANTVNGTLSVKAGSVRLGKSNGVAAWSGSVLLDGGSLSMTASGQLAATATLTVRSGNLDLQGQTATVAVVKLENDSVLATQGTLNGNFNGAAGTRIAPTASLTLGNSNSYTGFRTAGLIEAGSASLTVNNKGFAPLGYLTTINGGMINAPNGVLVGAGAVLTGNGSVSGRISAGFGSTIAAEGGDMLLGDMSAPDGFYSDGSLIVGSSFTRLFDANQAVLGSLTTLGDGAFPGSLMMANGAVLNQGKNLTGHGMVMGGAGLVVDGAVHGSGPDPDDGITFNLPVSGYGSFTGNVTFNNGFSPGHSPQDVHLENVFFGSANLLLMELGGLTAGEDYDQLVISGSAHLAGTLAVTLIDGFVPAAGNRFELFSGGTLSGTFELLDLPTLASGLLWDTDSLYSEGALEVGVAAPTAPTALTAVWDSARSMRLEWTDHATNETGYELQRADDVGFSVNVVSIPLPADCAAHTDTGLIPGTVYHYRVRSVGAGGNSAFSNPAQGITLTVIEEWRVAKFGAPAPDGIAANDQDPDHDGAVNLLEFACGLEPLLADARPLPAGGTAGLPAVGMDGAGHLQFTFVRRKALSVPGIHYQVVFSSDLVGWAENPGAVEGKSSIDETWERVTVTDTATSAATPARFCRLQVE